MANTNNIPPERNAYVYAFIDWLVSDLLQRAGTIETLLELQPQAYTYQDAMAMCGKAQGYRSVVEILSRIVEEDANA